MMKATFSLLNFVLAILLSSCAATISSPAADSVFRPELFPTNIHRVIFLGDSITYSGQYVEYIETYFRTRHPERRVEFINVGLPSETVSGLSEPEHLKYGFPRPDLHERLARVLAQTKPQLVFACYGMNDGIYLPFDEGRFGKFQDGIRWLHDEVQKAGAKIIHLTPSVFDETKGGHPGYSAVLDRYSEWLVGQRTAGWSVVDLHEPMKRALAEQRKRDPAFVFAKDGVHVGDGGHWVMAQQILLYLGVKDVATLTNAVVMIPSNPHVPELLKLEQQRQNLLKNAWLTAIGHKRPMMQTGLPLAEAEKKAAEIEEQIRRLLL
jgi:lysophospholipase L1-like esterase